MNANEAEGERDGEALVQAFRTFLDEICVQLAAEAQGPRENDSNFQQRAYAFLEFVARYQTAPRPVDADYQQRVRAFLDLRNRLLNDDV